MENRVTPLNEYVAEEKYFTDVLFEYSSKDKMRINDIIRKSNGNTGRAKLYAKTMCKLIRNPDKARDRYDAAKEILGNDHPVTIIFRKRVVDLSGEDSLKTPVASQGKDEALNPPASQRKKGVKYFKGKHVFKMSDRDNASPILPVGAVNLKTGKCKYFNIFDTWDGTVEVWLTNPESWSNKKESYKLVFTAGDTPYGGIGAHNGFQHDQTRRFLFNATMVDYTRVKDMAALIPLYGKTIGGYTYK